MALDASEETHDIHVRTCRIVGGQLFDGSHATFYFLLNVMACLRYSQGRLAVKSFVLQKEHLC